MEERNDDFDGQIGPGATPMQIYSAALYATPGQLEQYARLIRPPLTEADMPSREGF